MKKKFWTILLAGLLAVSVTGCGAFGMMMMAGVATQLERGLEVQNPEGAVPQATAPYEMVLDEEFGYFPSGLWIGEKSAMMAAEEGYPAPDWNTEEYDYIEESGWKSAKTTPFSTFAADVDTASYANLRRMILRGNTIPKDAVRIEEMINYFSYDYPEPEGEDPFSVTMEMGPCPWNENAKLLLIGLKTKDLAPEEHAPSNLVFLIDVSGSMDEPDKLPLVQRAFKLLTENLRPEDTISVVTYASSDQVVLDGVTGEEPEKIRSAIEDLMAGGGTNGSSGIVTAYSLAEKHFIEGGNNRVILATDGDLNLGVTDKGSLTRLITEQAKSGVYLSVLGFGSGNLSDARMEALADNGNGNYHYIDDIGEARKVLTEEMGGTLVTVAKDVKLQVEFNPAKVAGYRQIGYENRQMAAEDFADDTKDGGEIGAGHCVTVLYEIALQGSGQELPNVDSRYEAQVEGGASEELFALNIRYKEPDGQESKLLVFPATEEILSEQLSDDAAWAAGVAAFGMILRTSEHVGDMTAQQVRTMLTERFPGETDTYRQEFLYLLTKFDPENIGW